MATDPRRRGRVLAMQALYEADVSSHLAEEAIDRLSEGGDVAVPRAALQFARDLTGGVVSNREAIDRLIGETATRFPVEDLAAVDRNILRVAVFELAFDARAPVRVVVDEAVELAKLYGTDTSPRFVNGVLGTIAAHSGRPRPQAQASEPEEGTEHKDADNSSLRTRG